MFKKLAWQPCLICQGSWFSQEGEAEELFSCTSLALTHQLDFISHFFLLLLWDTCEWRNTTFPHSLRSLLETMASHQLAIAKATFSAGLLRPDPTSLSRDEIANFHSLLNSVVVQCSPINVQVWFYTLNACINAMTKWSMRIEMQAMDFGQHLSV